MKITKHFASKNFTINYTTKEDSTIFITRLLETTKTVWKTDTLTFFCPLNEDLVQLLLLETHEIVTEKLKFKIENTEKFISILKIKNSLDQTKAFQNIAFETMPSEFDGILEIYEKSRELFSQEIKIDFNYSFAGGYFLALRSNGFDLKARHQTDILNDQSLHKIKDLLENLNVESGLMDQQLYINMFSNIKTINGNMISK